MTLNDQIEALVLKNKVIKPVNITTFKNPFLLLSSTRALNELVTNTKPSDRARQQGIEDDKAYLKTPSGARSDRKAPKEDEKQDTQPMPPKRKAKAKPATSSVKTPKTASVPTKESKAASKKLIAAALDGGMEKVLSAKGVADNIVKRGRGRPKGAINAPGVTNAPRNAQTQAMGRKQGVVESIPDEKDVVAAKIAKQKNEGKLKDGNRRLGTKTQKKKK